MVEMGYEPTKRIAGILNWTLARVQGVPYRVTGRWAFYQGVQELGLTKKDNKNFNKWTSRARKNFWNGWAPWTLADDTRGILSYGDGFESFEDWLDSFKGERPVYEKFSTQKNLVMIWFEAEAMRAQFEYYAAPHHIPLAPFRGDPGPDYKWRLAKFLCEMTLKYDGKPIVVLYFGDYEPLGKTGSRGKGIRIPLDALKDIRPWFEALYMRGIEEMKAKMGETVENPLVPAINFVRCGLNPEHIAKWKLPQNPQRLEEYQWEALSDERARELIVGSIGKYWSSEAVRKVEHREERDKKKWAKILGEIKLKGVK